MLALEVTLLTGRYVATAYDDRNSAEWPPHPARLFSALVAAHFDAGEPAGEERAVLEWLEQQGAPNIHASQASRREVTTVFVPVNDATVVGSLEDEAAAVDVARTDFERAEGKARVVAEKKLSKLEARLVDATKKALAAVPSGKETKEGPGIAASLLPDFRKKQPRTFPSVTPEDPRVLFAWANASPTDSQRHVLDGLAAKVVRLGHSSSLVSVRVSDAATAPTWIRDETGEVYDGNEPQMLRVVTGGQLAALDELYSLQADAPGRIMPAAFERYVRPKSDDKASVARSVFGEDWIVLRRLSGKAGGLRLPSTRAVDVARTLRKAMLAGFGEGAPEVLSGHRADGATSSRPHAAYVPLPFLGSRHADGAILGVAVVLPRSASGEDRVAVNRALHAWHTRNGRSTDDDGRLVVPLHFGRSGELLLSLLDESPRRESPLAIGSWCRASRIWASATPVALDRNPGDLRANDPQVEAAAYSQAEATIATACQHVGLPKPARVTALPAAPLAGSDKARAFPAFLAGKPPIQRVLVHALLTFNVPVRGPILLGAGRYVGLGLFRPIEDRDD